jgi:hypothetical protein
MSHRPSQHARLDKAAYHLGRSFLLKFKPVTPQLLDRYLSVPDGDRPKDLAGIFYNLVFSAQNRHALPRVIGGAVGGVDKLSGVLCEFEPGQVLEKFAIGGSERLLDDIIKGLLSHRPPRRESNSLWPRFCTAVLCGAEFLSQFKDGREFHSWVAFFDNDDRARPALPALLSHELHGFGFPLACDFLKELGYHNFAKPDVHLKAIFPALSLSESGDDYTVFKAITRLAANAGVTPYAADKVFWLISSGRFYHDGFEIGNHRDEFIEHARGQLQIESDG